MVMEGGGDVWLLVEEAAPPQAAREKERKSKRAGVGARIGSVIFGWRGRRDNWT
jgi:hypothetical protein